MPRSFKSDLIDLAEGGGKILMKYFLKAHRIEHKPGAGIVTEADKGAEAYLVKKILRKFPDSSIIAEESGEFRQGNELCWVIDPLDGTTNYAHGFPWFCVSIGLYENGAPRAGVIFQPITGEMFFAERGKGAFLNKKRIRVSTTKRVQDALLGTGFYYCQGQSQTEEMAFFHKVNQVALGVRRPGSAALDLAFVACGRYDGFWERGLAPWDVAAGFLIVEEAGGSLSNYSGGTTTMHEAEVVATNGKIHRQIVELISGKRKTR